ncbi:DUF4142 domain-containing protein [Paraflavitalea speifideaquila]|uniref:DUF4142 domain-containing protein n=1 Tax=Paraflavitalea speifideaquila TaxID=3076558 RepID=UPI0028E2DB80|nr:DUF4142 domain-containing protein [Paraflavitalea speifideiaquila]
MHFVVNALQRAEETIALADLGMRKASRPAIKEVAQRIGLDQRQLYSGLQKLQKKAASDSMPNYNDGSRKELAQLSGKAFDEQWVEKMVTWNAAGISRYEAESRAAKEKGIKKLVTDVLPILKANQQQLESCRDKS